MLSGSIKNVFGETLSNDARAELRGFMAILVRTAAGWVAALGFAALPLAGHTASAPLPDVRQLLHEVQEHQKTLEKVRETYTYSSLQTRQDIDAKGNVTKTESQEGE